MDEGFEAPKKPDRFFAFSGRCASRLGRAIEDIRDRAALHAEFAHLRDSGQLEHVLDDIGVEPSQLSTLIQNHPGARRHLAAMLKRLRIKPTSQALGSAEMRAIERTCLLFAVSGKCDRWLGSDGSADPARFCPNAAAF